MREIWAQPLIERALTSHNICMYLVQRFNGFSQMCVVYSVRLRICANHAAAKSTQQSDQK